MDLGASAAGIHGFCLHVLAMTIDFTKIAISWSFASSNGDSRVSGNRSARMIKSNQHCDSRTLLANSVVVHADETSWSINSVWAFLSEKARLFFFGVHKDGETLKQILDAATFAGIVISCSPL